MTNHDLPKVCAVVCEYDPFHNGHMHHLRMAKELSHADYIICMMSGCVTQRGNFARYDKFLRATSALQNGADLVFELPARFSCSAAQEFAGGAIQILSQLGVVTHLSFGCESEILPYLDKDDFFSYGNLSRKEESPEFKALLHYFQKSGLSYPAAYAHAISQLTGNPELTSVLSEPNTILAFQYLRHLPEDIQAVPVERIGSYHDNSLSVPFPSASAIREAAIAGDFESARNTLPDYDLFSEAEIRQDVHETDALSEAVLFLLRTMSPEAIEEIYGMSEGLHLRFIECARQAKSRSDLIMQVKTKRFTYARLSRVCTNLLLGLTKTDAALMKVPDHVRLLGFRKSASPLLHLLKQYSRIPVIVRARDLPADSHQQLLDRRAQDLWSLGCKNPELRKSGRDLVTPIIRL